jgi:ABC-type methionine transport system ATPase subunit
LSAVGTTTRLRLRLTFPTHLVQEPIVYRLVKDFDIVINIRRADVKADHGWMALELDGEPGALERGVKWLKEKGIQVDPIERDVISP